MLDTDIYAEALKAIDSNVTRNAATYRGFHGRLTVSAITLMEITQGLSGAGAGPPRFAKFHAAVAREEVLSFNRAAADLAGWIAGDLDRIGRTIGRCDPMIAAVAITQGLELATGNTAHYDRVRQLGFPLTLSNWRVDPAFP